MKTLRKLRNQAPKHIVRPRSIGPSEFDISDAAGEEPAPEAVFDRITGPYGRRYTPAAYSIGCDEET